MTRKMRFARWVLKHTAAEPTKLYAAPGLAAGAYVLMTADKRGFVMLTTTKSGDTLCFMVRGECPVTVWSVFGMAVWACWHWAACSRWFGLRPLLWRWAKSQAW